jgi:SAM-dependent methyltransferase
VFEEPRRGKLLLPKLLVLNLPMDRFTELNSECSYRDALEQEKRIYKDCTEVHNLPAIFHYWSERHLRAKLLPFGLDSPNSMFRKNLEEQCGNSHSRQMRFVSLGAGNCELEIDIALHLRAQRMSSFTITCIDLNAAMLERGRNSAARAGVRNQLRFVPADLNAWNPEDDYDAVLANQTLHHVVNLEGLFDQIGRSLRPEGRFIVSDMVSFR